MIHIAPSILAADFARLGEQVLEVERAGARRIHIDVMDGHFVPNLSMGPVVVKGLRKVTRLPLEVHLMVENPEHFAESFLRAGADTLIVHWEVLPDPHGLIADLHAKQKKIGVAIKPDTPVEVLDALLPNIDLALCMTVYPGFGGQQFIPGSLTRIARLREKILRLNPACELEVDGGIDHDNTPLVVEKGADVLVMGTAIFGATEGPGTAVRKVSELAQSVAKH